MTTLHATFRMHENSSGEWLENCHSGHKSFWFVRRPSRCYTSLTAKNMELMHHSIMQPPFHVVSMISTPPPSYLHCCDYSYYTDTKDYSRRKKIECKYAQAMCLKIELLPLFDTFLHFRSQLFVGGGS